MRAILHVEIVTPCFLGGSDPQAVAEWRAQSMRGQLRWWFRALAGGRLLDRPAAERLALVRSWEAALFGDTRTRSPLAVVPLDAPPALAAGPAPHDFRMAYSAEELAAAWGIGPADAGYQSTLARLRIERGDRLVATNPLLYLGYGCLEYVQGGGVALARSCFFPGGVARILLRWHESARKRMPQEAWALLQDSLWAWLHLGGIGSRSRNGFGSLSLREVEGELPTGDRPTLPRLASAAGREELESGFRSLVAAARGRGADAGWTCLSPSSRAFVGPQKGSWREALGVAGAWLIAYRRRYGHPSDPRVRNGTPLASRDYVWAYSPANRQAVPDRSGFGLPLPFGKKHETATWGTQGNQGAFTDQRRASPLLLSVVRLGNGFAPIFTYLPSQFLPANAELGFKERPQPRRAPNTLQLSIVDDFLDELASRKLAQEIR